jgi:hypothetical protein
LFLTPFVCVCVPVSVVYRLPSNHKQRDQWTSSVLSVLQQKHRHTMGFNAVVQQISQHKRGGNSVTSNHASASEVDLRELRPDARSSSSSSLQSAEADMLKPYLSMKVRPTFVVGISPHQHHSFALSLVCPSCNSVRSHRQTEN